MRRNLRRIDAVFYGRGRSPAATVTLHSAPQTMGESGVAQAEAGHVGPQVEACIGRATSRWAAMRSLHRELFPVLATVPGHGPVVQAAAEAAWTDGSWRSRGRCDRAGSAEMSASPATKPERTCRVRWKALGQAGEHHHVVEIAAAPGGGPPPGRRRGAWCRRSRSPSSTCRRRSRSRSGRTARRAASTVEGQHTTGGLPASTI